MENINIDFGQNVGIYKGQNYSNSIAISIILNEKEQYLNLQFKNDYIFKQYLKPFD